MITPKKEVELAKIPYSHKQGAANLLISKAQRLAEFSDLSLGDMDDKEIKKALEAVSFYDLALSLMKPYDGNYETIIHWKCLALIALEQYEEASDWYEELIRLSGSSKTPDIYNATAKEAKRQLSKIIGKKNSPLPLFDEKEYEFLDDPGFCWWAMQFCEALAKRKFKIAYEYLSEQLHENISQTELKKQWTSILNDPKDDVDINLERYDMANEEDDEDFVSWCYFTVSGADINEAISLDIYKRADGYEIRGFEFGRP
ncbi:MAG TPA: hypothetical protein ENK06_05485 [Gammaproteobacteria bacterium]|nr:hypothetical protein [Gammaproteobacteria bacterium]